MANILIVDDDLDISQWFGDEEASAKTDTQTIDMSTIAQQAPGEATVMGCSSSERNVLYCLAALEAVLASQGAAIATGRPSCSPTWRTSSLNKSRSGSTSAKSMSSGSPPTL